MFETMTSEQYRSLDIDALEARQSELVALADSDVDAAEYKAECERCMDEIAHRNQKVELRNASLLKLNAGSGKTIERAGNKEVDEIDPYDTPEYRKAFMEYMCRKTPMPESMMKRNDAYTTTTDVPVMIPTTISTKIIEKLEEYGEIYARVAKTNIKGGVEYPILDLKPVASWVGEEQVSNWQKLEAKDKISFGYFELECRIAQTMLASIVTFDEFQRRFVPLATKAMIQKIEEGIIKGTGSGQMLGIVNDTRIENIVGLDATDVADWKQWHKKVKASIPRMYRNGTFIMAQSTWDCYIETLANDINAPVSINYNAVTGVEEMRLMGFPVMLVDDTVLPDFDSADDGDVFAIYGKLDDYVINTNQQLMTVQYPDWDTRKQKTVAYMVLDGKVLDPYGFMLIKKGDVESE